MVLSHARERKTFGTFVGKGEKSTGYSPIVVFDILESGAGEAEGKKPLPGADRQRLAGGSSRSYDSE